VDVTDGLLCGASQLLHVQQAIAAMKLHNVDDPDLFVTAMVHDLGKLFLLSGEVPENVLGRTGRLENHEPGCGLDQVYFQFGHAELIYSRIRDHVPEHIAWTARYHNIDLADAAQFMNERDKTYASKYLEVFRTFDGGFKSIHWIPTVDMDECRELIRR